jgi:UDP-N-acetylmuramyl pentapeptide phosphotransferase/UDP-N-acetylglucosamine-1-phosphate transferase
MKIVIYILCMAVGACGAFIIYRWGWVLGVLDKANHRSSHNGEVPKGGGIGILAAFVFSAVLIDLPPALWVSLAAVALLSFYGDKVDISPKFRLSMQFTAAFMVLLYALTAVSDIEPLTSDIWSFPFVLCPLFFAFFIVGTANYYNFMDGINGIAGITGVVAFGLMAYFSGISGTYENLRFLSICMVFACLGFLPFNLPKARVFMGDVGSILLGFLFATMVVLLSRSLNDFIVLCAFLFPFYADELTTQYVRLKIGENLLQPHRRHVYQLLANEMGIVHWKVSLGYGVLQTFVGLVALGIRDGGTVVVAVFLACCFTGFWIFGYRVRRRAEIHIKPKSAGQL